MRVYSAPPGCLQTPKDVEVYYTSLSPEKNYVTELENKIGEIENDLEASSYQYDVLEKSYAIKKECNEELFEFTERFRKDLVKNEKLEDYKTIQLLQFLYLKSAFLLFRCSDISWEAYEVAGKVNENVNKFMDSQHFLGADIELSALKETLVDAWDTMKFNLAWNLAYDGGRPEFNNENLSRMDSAIDNARKASKLFEESLLQHSGSQSEYETFRSHLTKINEFYDQCEINGYFSEQELKDIQALQLYIPEELIRQTNARSSSS